MNCRSGSVGNKRKQLEEEADSEHEPIQFSAKPQQGGVVVDPREIRITETSPDGDTAAVAERDETTAQMFVDMTAEGGGDGDEEREGWGNKLDFLFSCISVSVGLGSKSDLILFQKVLSDWGMFYAESRRAIFY